jgi:hypothetical protein
MHDNGGDRRDVALDGELAQSSQQVLRVNERVRGFVRRLDEELARSSKLLSGAVDRAEDG